MLCKASATLGCYLDTMCTSNCQKTVSYACYGYFTIVVDHLHYLSSSTCAMMTKFSLCMTSRMNIHERSL